MCIYIYICIYTHIRILYTYNDVIHVMLLYAYIAPEVPLALDYDYYYYQTILNYTNIYYNMINYAII